MPQPSHPPDAAPPPDHARARELLARKWAYLLSQASVVPLSRNELDRELADQLDTVCAAMADGAASVSEVGERLVTLGYLGEAGLRCTMEVLGKGLPALPEFQPAERFTEPIVTGLGALASGFLAASQRALLDQQESMHLSLLKAVRDAKWHLRESEARFEEVVTASASGVLLVGLDGLVVRANAAIGDMLGRSPAELVGTGLADLVHPDSAEILAEALRALLDGRKERIKQAQRLRRSDGDVARITLTASLLRSADDQPAQFVVVAEDGTELMLLQSELSRQALHDILTGLPNRQFFGTHTETVLLRMDPVRGITLFHLELDAFDMVCNSLGRRAGERLLAYFAQRLKSVMARENAMIARLDGAGFGILIENSATTPDVAAIMASINDERADPFYVDGHGLAVSASAGVVHRPSPGMDPGELLRAAEEALRRAKCGRRGQWQVFEPGSDVEVRRRQTLAVGMAGAWENGEIGVRYRPVVRLDDGTVAGVEALLRWDRPGLEPLAHGECVRLADETGLMLPLGEWLLRVACGQAEWWRRQSGTRLPLIVGLSAHQVSDRNLVRRLAGVLDEIGLDPGRLVVGVPVSALPGAGGALCGLAGLGVRTMLDDFTFGPDDLLAAREFSVAAVRVARRLVERRPAGLDELIRCAGATVVSGIVTAEQAEWWRAAGAEVATGEQFGEPCAPDEV